MKRCLAPAALSFDRQSRSPAVTPRHSASSFAPFLIQEVDQGFAPLAQLGRLFVPIEIAVVVEQLEAILAVHPLSTCGAVGEKEALNLRRG